MELFFPPKPQINDCIFTEESTKVCFLLKNAAQIYLYLCAFPLLTLFSSKL